MAAEITDLFGKNSISSLMLPSSPSLPPKKEEGTGNPIFCSPWTLFGNPAICFPISDRHKHRLMYSVQLVGQKNKDCNLLLAAQEVNSALLDRYVMEV